jgi:hypothetical protein
LPDPDRATDKAGGIGLGFEGVVADEGGLGFVGDEGEAALFRVGLVNAKAWTWRRKGSRRRPRAQWMNRANSSSVVSLATVRRMRARSRGL